jgi:hypothetical protein
MPAGLPRAGFKEQLERVTVMVVNSPIQIDAYIRLLRKADGLS